MLKAMTARCHGPMGSGFLANFHSTHAFPIGTRPSNSTWSRVGMGSNQYPEHRRVESSNISVMVGQITAVSHRVPRRNWVHAPVCFKDSRNLIFACVSWVLFLDDDASWSSIRLNRDSSQAASMTLRPALWASSSIWDLTSWATSWASASLSSSLTLSCSSWAVHAAWADSVHSIILGVFLLQCVYSFEQDIQMRFHGFHDTLSFGG